eukprot:TRINITY_DN10295_c0_g3_i1.p1 TRINITY_DN10295_c0_g3~~TRINITY_DN10295_c0_g3_i1.p1  ORF type:complete len:883 (-),score=107.10 TRINITY_DN10295_c0_g3_i1:793-3441(-)
MSNRERRKGQMALRIVLAAVCSTLLLWGSPVEGSSAQERIRNQAAASLEKRAPKLQVSVYIVVLNAPSCVTYTGGVDGLAATAPPRGHRLPRHSSAVAAYSSHVARSHTELLQAHRIRPAKKVQSFTHAINAFSASLTKAEAAALNANPDVASVQKQAVYTTSTFHTPKYLNVKPGLWSQAGGKESAGENMVIAVIDTGIWPEHPSFSDVGPHAYGNLSAIRPTWAGTCSITSDFPGCNNKLVGARYFLSNVMANGESLYYTESASARDTIGHGSHVSGIAAGNFGVQATYDNLTDIGDKIGAISGMAPRARLSVYKVFWTVKDPNPSPWSSGFINVGLAGDVVAALDQATADGVDVINFSADSNGAPNMFDPVAIAALSAAKTGIFFATTSGNTGPNANTMNNVQPWVMTVGAISDDRVYSKTVNIANATSSLTIQGQLFSPASPGSPNRPFPTRRKDGWPTLLSAGDAALGTDYYSELLAGYCLPGFLDPAKVNGTIVVCQSLFTQLEFDVNYPVSEVQAKGGVGVIIANSNPQMPPSRWAYGAPASFPIIQISYADGQALLAMMKASIVNGTETAVAYMTGSELSYNQSAIPRVMDFSSRGPAFPLSDTTLANDVLKPDVVAPGHEIWSAFSPLGGQTTLGASKTGQLFNIQSGTSMSAPHIAGIAAVIMQINPTFSPFAVKSAILSTASNLAVFGNGVSGIGYADQYSFNLVPATPKVQTPFDYGSGIVDPQAAADPGLVFNSNFNDYVAYLYTVDPNQAGITGVANPGRTVRGRDLNLPTISISQLSGSTTVTRNVTRVGNGPKIWVAFVTTPVPGVLVTVTPVVFTLNKLSANQTLTFNFTVTNASSAPNFVFGNVLLSNGKYGVMMTLAVQPVSV